MFYAFYLAILVVIGCAWVFAHEVAASLPIWEGTFSRILGVFVASSIFVYAAKADIGFQELKAKEKKLPLRLTILGCLGLTVYFAASFAALTHLTSSEVGMAMAMIPGIAYVISLLFFKESFSARKILGLVVASAGTILYINNGSSLSGISSLTGLILAFVSVVAYALYGLLYKKWMSNIGAVTVLPYMSVAALIAALPFLAFELLFMKSLPALYDFANGFILGAIFTMPVFAIYQKLIKLRGPIVANTVGLLTPFAVMISELIFNKKDMITALDVVALVACIFGISLIILPGPITFFLNMFNKKTSP